MLHQSKFKKLCRISGIAILAIGLAACGNNQTDQNTSDTKNNTTEEQHSNTRKVTDAMGHEIEVPVHPERVLATYLEDYLVALNVKPVAQWSVSNGIQDYLQDDLLEGVPTIPHDLPFEAVQELSPDLIIMDSAEMVEGGKYEQYSKIAPTYVVGNNQNNNWRDELIEVGKVLNKEDEAKQVLAEYEKLAKDAKEKLASKGTPPSAAAVWLVNNNFFIVSSNLSSGDVLYNDLGLEVPSVVEEISAKATSNWNPISLEKLTELDADYLFLINSDKQGASEINKNLWNTIPAVQNNQVIEIPASSSWLYTGTIANTEIIEDVLEAIK